MVTVCDRDIQLQSHLTNSFQVNLYKITTSQYQSLGFVPMVTITYRFHHSVYSTSHSALDCVGKMFTYSSKHDIQ